MGLLDPTIWLFTLYHTNTLLEQIDKVLILTQFYTNVTGQLKSVPFLFAN